jgi:hypothetical protein
MLDIINSIIFHPYVLALYGVTLWQIEQWFTSRKPFLSFIKDAHRNIGRSLVWVGIVVVFDDEIMAKYNQWAAVDYSDIPLYFYTIAGFFIDLIRTKIIDKVK